MRRGLVEMRRSLPREEKRFWRKPAVVTPVLCAVEASRQPGLAFVVELTEW